ncbi:branched-chain amino acid ABC transporter permease [Desulfatibacillum aliphaticivorans]|uniref:branched-chain amino acid ABC transporter permease n=1 Tax=Desulfatibacillum aliphaticivorans TaxID=218208 RepID=UPI0004846E81|nr:branched-chain amino acid ABC transporter permease [Desulfatibacillum aliphaticivorans]
MIENTTMDSAEIKGGQAVQSGFSGAVIAKWAGIWLGFILISLALPKIFDSRFAMSMFNQMGIAIVFALSFNMLLGQGGLLSFGHAVFYGMGGFGAIHVLCMVNDGELRIYTELLPLAGGIFSAILGFILGFISTRRAAIPFALITMGIGELLLASSLLLPSFFGGEEGIAGDRWTEITMLPFKYGQAIEVYYLILIWMFLSVAAMYLLTKTPLGQMANAVRDNHQRAQFIGYDPHKVRTFQFTLAAFFAGIAGGLFAINYEMVTAENLGMLPSTDILMMTVIGGITYFFGPILGAIFITFLQLVVSNITHAWMLYFGLMFILMVMWAPDGLAGLIMRHQPIWRAKRMTKILPSYLVALIPGLVMFAGVIVLVEIMFHISLSIDPESPLSIMGVSFKAQAFMPWALGILLLGVGGYLFKLAARRVNQAWKTVLAEIKQEGV